MFLDNPLVLLLEVRRLVLRDRHLPLQGDDVVLPLRDVKLGVADGLLLLLDDLL